MGRVALKPARNPKTNLSLASDIDPSPFAATLAADAIRGRWEYRAHQPCADLIVCSDVGSNAEPRAPQRVASAHANDHRNGDPYVSRILVIGATGLIGSRVAARLSLSGHEVVGAARDVASAARRSPTITWRRFDFGDWAAADWAVLLRGLDAVVNCAGALQSGAGDQLPATHADGPKALFRACQANGVRRVVHFSAMGVDRATPTEFSRTKFAADTALVESDLDWVILRPSVVLGSPAYGASALVRGLAALPIVPLMPNTAPLQPVVLDDVTATAAFFTDTAAPSRVAVELAGPDEMTFNELVRIYRRWLGYRPAREFSLSDWLAGLMYRAGDLASVLGWRPPVRSTARDEVARGAVGDPSNWQRLTGFHPRSIGEMLAEHPASVQEIWFSSLYLLKPFLLISVAVFWIGSGVASLGPGYRAGVDLVAQGGGGAVAPLLVIAGGAVDVFVGLGICVRRLSRLALLAGIAVSALYAVAGTIVAPALWLEPLAPLLKIAPVIALHCAALAVLRDR